MPGADHFRRQATIYDRVAAQCTIPELIGYYERLARDCRDRADAEEAAATPAHPDAIDDDI
jgi:hypothetical protein